ncbi:MAG TPA: hypothetical protein VHU13_08025 [Solirubrobacteraceae bacterium]|jgi:hypothetical protein|nr:hypothetical protein [Solirubrobacteraceae bacterium]
MTAVRRAGSIALAVSLCWLLAAADGAGATPSARLRVAFVPDRPGARTTVELSLRISSPTADTPPLRAFALRLPSGMGVATSTLGENNCDPAALLASGLAGCPLNARLGYGSADAVVPVGAQAISEQAAVYPLMGLPAENRVEVLFYVEARTPVFAQLVLPAGFAEDVPPFGERLETAVPLVQAWPEGPDLSLRSFSSTLGPLHLVYHRRVGGRTVDYTPHGIRIPSSCPPHGYPFAASLRFADGTSTTSSYRVPCQRH